LQRKIICLIVFAFVRDEVGQLLKEEKDFF